MNVVKFFKSCTIILRAFYSLSKLPFTISNNEEKALLPESSNKFAIKSYNKMMMRPWRIHEEKITASPNLGKYQKLFHVSQHVAVESWQQCCTFTEEVKLVWLPYGHEENPSRSTPLKKRVSSSYILFHIQAISHNHWISITLKYKKLLTNYSRN